MQKVLVETQNLGKVYWSDGIPNKVINRLHLRIHHGEFTVIMGSSGSGKSTLLYLLSGLDRPSEGEVWLNNQPVHKMTEGELALLRRRSTGFVFQSANLVPYLSVLENVLVPGYLLSGSKNSIRQRALHLLTQMELRDLCNRLPSQLSGGEQQRAAIARALINTPSLLLADEPTGSLNSAASRSVLNLLTHFHEQGQSILMVTHDIKSACRGQRILYFRDGAIIDQLKFSQTASDLSGREQVLTAWLLDKGW